MRRKDAEKSRSRQSRRTISKARLEVMIDEATVDAYGESEQLGGLYTMIEDYLAVPFETTLLGVPVTVKSVDLTERDEIVAICTRGRLRQGIPILDLVLPSPAPAGAERWSRILRTAKVSVTKARRAIFLPQREQMSGSTWYTLAMRRAHEGEQRRRGFS